MGQSYKYTEPTIWALRKSTRQVRDATHSLYEHLYGYEPIRMPAGDEGEERVRRGSAQNPQLNIINPQTNFAIRSLDSAAKS